MTDIPFPIEAVFKGLCETPSDINQHLPKLRELADECAHVTEFGIRDFVSTVALLAGRPNTLVSWDISPGYILKALAKAAALDFDGKVPDFQPRVGNTLVIEIEPTDMLFIDSLHNYAQLKLELARHGMKAKKYLVFHDTHTFGNKDETTDLKGVRGPGLRQAIREFQQEHGVLWTCVHDSPENNGLIVLQRRPGVDIGAPFPICFLMD